MRNSAAIGVYVIATVSCVVQTFLFVRVALNVTSGVTLQVAGHYAVAAARGGQQRQSDS